MKKTFWSRTKIFKSPLLVTIGRWFLFWSTLLLIFVSLTAYLSFYMLCCDQKILLSDIGITYGESYGGSIGRQIGRFAGRVEDLVELVLTVTLLISMARHLPLQPPSSNSLRHISDILGSFVYGFIPSLFRPSFANCMIVIAGMMSPLIAIMVCLFTIMGL
jgi:hypothetical protein